MNILIGIFTAIHLMVAVFLIVLVLMQKSHEQGVGAAFGGGMTDTVFGGGTTTALVRMTIWCACILLATTLILAVLHSRRGRGTGRSLMERTLATSPSLPAPQPTAPFGVQPTAPATTTETPPAPSSAATESPASQPPAANPTGSAPAPSAPATSTTSEPGPAK